MGRRLWWGAIAGATAGLAMLACALGLAGLGRSGCVRPYLVLSAPGLSLSPQNAPIILATLVPGAALHETVAIALGLLGAWAVAPRARSLVAATWLVGGGLSMALLDAAVLAVRTPGLPLMANHLRSLEYLVFGLVAAARATVRSPSGALFHRIATPPGARGPGSDGPTGPPAAGRRVGRRQDSAHSGRVILQVVVAPHCFGCERARVLAAEVAARYPTLDVRVVDLAQPDVVAPPGLVAVPAYVLNGNVIFTGNPTPDALARALSGPGDSALATTREDA